MQAHASVDSERERVKAVPTSEVLVGWRECLSKGQNGRMYPEGSYKQYPGTVTPPGFGGLRAQPLSTRKV